MDRSPFSGRKVTLACGDRRDDYLGERLAELGADVWLLRRRPPRAAGMRHTSDPAEGLGGASVLVCPMPPFGPGGRVWSEDPEDRLFLTGPEFGLLARPSVVFAGSFPPELAAAAREAGCVTVSLAESDEVAVLNSIPTAEGAILLALERTTVTIRDSSCVVVGYGRCGQTLAQTLVGMGGRVRAVARRPEARARAKAAGCETFGFDELAVAVTGARFVFNTVPALVLVGDILSRAHPGAVIVDLASAPGGTDFEAAASVGVTAVLAPALPGRVAPESAASYLADVIFRVVSERFASGEV